MIMICQTNQAAVLKNWMCFLKSSLSYSLEDDAQRTTINERLKQSLKDFVIRVLAGKKHGANSTLDMLYSDAIKNQDLVLNDSDGILNQAIRMGNTEGARRMLHPKYSTFTSVVCQIYYNAWKS